MYFADFDEREYWDHKAQDRACGWIADQTQIDTGVLGKEEYALLEDWTSAVKADLERVESLTEGGRQSLHGRE